MFELLSLFLEIGSNAIGGFIDGALNVAWIIPVALLVSLYMKGENNEECR